MVEARRSSLPLAAAEEVIMRRRAFLAFIGSAIIASPRAAMAQSARRPVVAGLFAGSQTTGAPWLQAFQAGFRELGYVEGRDIDIVWQYADGDTARFPGLAEKLIALDPKVIVTTSVLSTKAVQQKTATIPIVQPMLADPIGLGFAASYAHPGGQITGILITLDSLPGKQLEIGAEAIPGLATVGFLNNANNSGLAMVKRNEEAAAASRNITLIYADVHGADDLNNALQKLSNEHVGLVFVPQDPLFFSERRQIAALAIAAHLPTLYAFREHVEEGGLMSYSVNIRDNYRYAATFVDKILKGAKPGDLPIELPRELELAINLKTAKALGLTIPPLLLARADEVIQ
jgi:putative tryptophan/tyrosine transport system substrate-binding protein